HPDGRVLQLATSFTEPPELVLGEQRLTHLNDDVLAAIRRPGIRPLEVTAPDGLRSEAWAFVPDGDGPWPTVLYVHGGPHCAYGDAYFIDFQLLVGAGFAVVAHNFRGSYGYGAEFAQSIGAEHGRNGALDHHATLDEAIRVGIADPERLGVCGLSH